MEKEKKGKLFIISTPIGNDDDISIRAMNCIKLSDKVVCEEFKEGAKFLSTLKLKKDILIYNEHSKLEDIIEIIGYVQAGQKVALISDCGTPLLADPGLELVQSCIKNNLEIEVIPGASSILTALLYSGFDASEFVFAGFLGRSDEERARKLRSLGEERRTVILLETPYRLKVLLQAASRVLPNRQAYLGLNLTHAYESHHYGTFAELEQKFRSEKIKAEFVIVFRSK